ncbi:hypothetical protein D3C84_1263540 [compost metagenome]
MRHAKIHQHNRRLQLVRQPDRFIPLRRFTDDRHSLPSIQQHAKPGTNNRVIVHDQ